MSLEALFDPRSLSAILAAVSYAIPAYLKTQPREPFDRLKFAITVAVGFAVGVGSVVVDMPVESVFTWFTQIGIIVMVENTVKAAYRWFKRRRLQTVQTIQTNTDGRC